MRYKAEYDEYSETNKFLDDLFEEDCEFGWSCEQPQPPTARNITVVSQEGQAEETYLKSLIEEIGEKLAEIVDKASSLPDDRGRGVFLTKEDLISRIISINNTVDTLLNDMEEISNSTATTTIIGGTLPFTTPMF